MKPPKLDPTWGKEVRAVYEHDMDEIWDRNRAPHLWNQSHNLLEIYTQLVGAEPSDVLDVGCAQATLAMSLAENGHSVTAVDIRQPFLDYAQTRYTHGDITFICGNALELDLDKQFDIVFANQILEHLVYPIEFIDKLSKIVKPDGVMVLSTPNWNYIKSSLPSFTELGDPKQWEHLQYTADGDGHFFAYTSKELTKIAKSAGLSEINVRNFETPWISGHMKIRYLHRILPVSILKFLDQLTLKLPIIGKKFSHQLLVVGRVQ